MNKEKELAIECAAEALIDFWALDKTMSSEEFIEALEILEVRAASAREATQKELKERGGRPDD